MSGSDQNRPEQNRQKYLFCRSAEYKKQILAVFQNQSAVRQVNKSELPYQRAESKSRIQIVRVQKAKPNQQNQNKWARQVSKSRKRQAG